MRTIICHPCWFDLIFKAVDLQPSNEDERESAIEILLNHGIRLVGDENCDKYASKVVPNDTRLIEHEQSDMDWVVYFGFYRIVKTDQPLFLEIDFKMGVDLVAQGIAADFNPAVVFLHRFQHGQVSAPHFGIQPGQSRYAVAKLGWPRSRRNR